MNMKNLSITIFIFLISSGITFSQSNNYSDIFEKGNEAFNRKEYFKADSLYTLCISQSADGNIFFNRAFCRLYLSDTCGYCNDLSYASFYFFDKEAFAFFSKDCFESVDTIYYSNEMKKTDPKSKYRYYEVNFKEACDSLRHYDFHDKRSIEYLRAVNQNKMSTILTGAIGKADYLARAYYRDTIRIFYYLKNSSMNEIIDENNYAYIQKCSSYLGSKYDRIKKNQKDHIAINLIIDDKGNIIERAVLENLLLNRNNPLFNDLEKELEDIFKKIPPVKPAMFQGKQVYYQEDYIFEF